MIETLSFGTAPEHGDVTVYQLSSAKARVRVMDFGATLVGVDVPDAAGELADVVLGFPSIEGYLDDPACYGCTIGPSANRTDRAEVPVAGALCHLPRNDGPDQLNNLHTDLDRGLHKRLWRAEAREDECAVVFTIDVGDGEYGLPGARRFTARYHLEDAADGAVLTVEYGCESDAETFVNMTNHSYFNLAGHASGSVLGHIVGIDASSYLPLRPDNISRGDIAPVDGTPFDFRSPKELGRDINQPDDQLEGARGYDHCLCVEGFDPASRTPRPALNAHDPASGRSLAISITTPGAHLYTGNWLDDENAKDGAAYAPRAGFAFEPEFYPDNCHHEDWPHPACAPGEPYRSVIAYRFSTVNG